MFDLRIEDGAAWLTLTRPEARNAIQVAQWPLLETAVAEAETSGARILFVRGAGRAFCGGADLAEFERMQAEAGGPAHFRQAMRKALNRLRDCPIPTVAVIEGACFGAGVALAMACDMRIAGAAASFAITPAKLGIAYPQEDISNLVALVGPGQAARLLFSAAAIDGAEAARIGLVELDAGEELAAVIAGLVEAVTANDPASLTFLKRGIRLAGSGVEQDDGQDAGFDALIGSDELLRRLARHRARRANLPATGQSTRSKR